jgi:hypothetical protein
MSRISVIEASLLYRVTNRTVYNWIMEDAIECVNGTYDLDKLQAAYDNRRKSKPRVHILRK